MAETPAPTPAEQLNGLLKQAEKSANDVEENFRKTNDILAKMNELLLKAADSQKKADDEALRAQNAKNQVEEHSKVISVLRADADGVVSSISNKIPVLESLAQTITNLNKSCEADVQAIKDLRKNAFEENKSISDISVKVSASNTIVEEYRKATDDSAKTIKELLARTKAEADDVSSSKKVADGLNASMKNLETNSAESLAVSKKTAESILILEKNSKEKYDSMTSFSELSKEVAERVSKYEGLLTSMSSDFSDIHEKIESLLPGATSASLAASFNAAKKRFFWPQILWLGGFIVCILLLLGLGIWGVIDANTHLMLPLTAKVTLSTSDQGWDSLLRQFVQRLPYVIPLVWFGVYAARQHSLSIRMEEEYAFKEATSMAFEGYKREMGNIPGSPAGTETPINTLCSNVLGSLSRRPGLIYEGKNQDITPLSPAVDALEKFSEGFAGLMKLKTDENGSLVEKVAKKVLS